MRSTPERSVPIDRVLCLGRGRSAGRQVDVSDLIAILSHFWGPQPLTEIFATRSLPGRRLAPEGSNMHSKLLRGLVNPAWFSRVKSSLILIVALSTLWKLRIVCWSFERTTDDFYFSDVRPGSSRRRGCRRCFSDTRGFMESCGVPSCCARTPRKLIHCPTLFAYHQITESHFYHVDRLIPQRPNGGRGIVLATSGFRDMLQRSFPTAGPVPLRVLPAPRVPGDLRCALLRRQFTYENVEGLRTELNYFPNSATKLPPPPATNPARSASDGPPPPRPPPIFPPNAKVPRTTRRSGPILFELDGAVAQPGSRTSRFQSIYQNYEFSGFLSVKFPPSTSS